MSSRCEDLDIRVEVDHRLVIGEKRLEQPRLDGGRQFHDVVDRRHTVHFEFVQTDVKRGDDLEGLAGQLGVVCLRVEHQHRERPIGIVSHEGPRENTRVRQVVTCDDRAGHHLGVGRF